MQINLKNRRLLLLSAPLLLILLYLGFEQIQPYLPAGGEQLQEEVARKRELLARYKARLAAREAYQSQVEENRRRLESFGSQFLEPPDPAQGSAYLLEIITRVAGEAGLQSQRKEFQSAKRLNPDYQKVSAKIDAYCSAEQLVLFLAALRNQEKHLFIEELVLRSQTIRNVHQLFPSMQIAAIVRSPEVREEKVPRTAAAQEGQ